MTLTQGTPLLSGAYTIRQLHAVTELTEIYEATDNLNGTTVLVHKLRDCYEGYADMFTHVASALPYIESRTLHPMLRVRNEDFSAYYITEYIQGHTLDTTVPSHGLTPKAALHMVMELANTVRAIHAADISLSVLTPADIVIRDTDGTPAIRSFSLPLPLAIHSTPNDNPYSAPERYATTGRKNQAHDIYSLGAILYFCITGVSPFSASYGSLRQLTFTPEMDDQIKAIIAKALSHSIYDRYIRIDDFISDLTRVSLPEPRPVPEPQPEPEPEPEPQPEPEPETETQPEPETQPAPEPLVDNIRGNSVWKRKYIAIALLAIVGIITGIIYARLNSGEKISSSNVPIIEDSVQTASNPATLTDATVTVGSTTFNYTGPVNKDGLPEGNGKATYPSGQWKSYEGEWKAGQWNGEGKLIYTNGDCYNGKFENNFFTTGTYTIQPDANGKGDYFTGEFRNGTPYNGAWYHANGKEFQRYSKGVVSQ